jgi:hypothetical protein
MEENPLTIHYFVEVVGLRRPNGGLHPQGKPSLRSPSSTMVAVLRRPYNVVTVEGLKIYGSPFSPYFRDWAFNATPLDDGGDEFMDRKFSRIPDDTDIFIIHGPPMGYGDSVSRHERVREQFTKTYGNLGQPAGSKVQNPS